MRKVRPCMADAISGITLGLRTSTFLGAVGPGAGAGAGDGEGAGAGAAGGLYDPLREPEDGIPPGGKLGKDWLAW